MAATLQDLIAFRAAGMPLKDATRRALESAPQPEPVPAPTDDGRRAPIAESPEIAAALAKIDALSARCDALIERNGRWTRYVTGGDNVA